MSDVSRRTVLGAGLLAAGVLGAGAGALSTDAGDASKPAKGGSVKPDTSPSAGGAAPLAQNPLLSAAIDRETALLDRLDAAGIGGTADGGIGNGGTGTNGSGIGPSLTVAAAVLRADHEAHRQALQALLASSGAGSTGTPTSGSSSTPSGSTSAAGTASSPASTSPTRTDLVAHEKAAARAAARDCATAPAALAALLASISACEATHAAWLA